MALRSHPLLLAFVVVALCSASPPTRGDDACAEPTVYRALDFWLGAWSVRDEGKTVADSVIERLPAGCAVLESYQQSDGYEGKSLNYVDPGEGRWRQVWIDSRGAVSEFRGEAGTATVAFTGETRVSGRRVLRRMTLAALPQGGVRQSSLLSRDEGRSFQPHYELQYVAGSARTRSRPCPSSGGEESQAAVRAVAAGIVEADNTADLERVLAFYAPDAVLLPPGALPVGGTASIRPRYERLFAEFTPHIETRVDRACVAEDVAFVEGHNGGRLVARGGGSDRPLDDTFLMVLRRREPSGWRISHLAWWR